jgi:hypothetical protein
MVTPRMAAAILGGLVGDADAKVQAYAAAMRTGQFVEPREILLP